MPKVDNSSIKFKARNNSQLNQGPLRVSYINPLMKSSCSYLHDALIEDDIKNANLLDGHRSKERTTTNQQSHRTNEEEYYNYTPRKRMKLKKDLNDTFQQSFTKIESKNYDNIINVVAS